MQTFFHGLDWFFSLGITFLGQKINKNVTITRQTAQETCFLSEYLKYQL